MYQYQEPEATQWDVDSERYAATIRDMELFNASEEKLPATELELRVWADMDRAYAARRAWDIAFDAACVAAGDLPW